MKHAQKIALFMAAGMVSAGAHAADFEVADGTTLTLGGEVVLNYLSKDTKGGDSETEFTDDGSLVLIGAERDLGNGYGAYVEAEFEYNTLGEGDGDISRGASVFGFTGDFGEIQIGDSDNVFEDLITDAIDPFENASLADTDRTPEDSMITYYSPDMGGFSYRLQTRVKDENDVLVEKGDGGNPPEVKPSGNEVSLIAAAAYDFGGITLSAGYDNRGSVDTEDGDAVFESEDAVMGLAAVADITSNAEASFRYARQDNKSGDDLDLTGAALVYNYGPGDVYGAVQGVSQDGEDSRTQVAGGVNYGVADGLLIFAEYGNFDGVSAGDKDKLAVAGLILEY
ncbi:porin [Spiribacter vilamensis]|uniref:Putative porin n=1 Tax=Spiribacter vilamensis TaxID=531306 RepID=A0A4Q8D1B1_9GAMM|nr:porin [Spiribacter vilamensis]RZU99146.1 putative porin [Spiribacter vilamensis]TVO61860.1 porin [Spiribacter vilamensis]